MRTDIAEREQEIRGWVAAQDTKASMCARLRCKPETLNAWMRKLGIEYQGNQGARGKKSSPHRLTAEQYCVTDSPKSHVLKKKLLEDGLRDESCEKCGLGTWLEAKIPLELHHVDGDRFNNDLDNVKLLCPNCHAQEPNNAGAAKGTYMC